MRRYRTSSSPRRFLSNNKIRQHFVTTSFLSVHHPVTGAEANKNGLGKNSYGTDTAKGNDNNDHIGEGEDDIVDLADSSLLRPGSNDGFFIIKTYETNKNSFDLEKIRDTVDDEDVHRLELNANNLTVPVALMLLDPAEYPSRSRARKACRKGNIMIHRGSLKVDPENGETLFNASQCMRARVGDRIYPGGKLIFFVSFRKHKLKPFVLVSPEYIRNT